MSPRRAGGRAARRTAALLALGLLGGCVADGIAPPQAEAVAKVSDLRSALGGGPALVPPGGGPRPAASAALASAVATPPPSGSRAAEAAGAVAALGAPPPGSFPAGSAGPSTTQAPVQVAGGDSVDALIAALKSKASPALVARPGAATAIEPAQTGPLPGDPADGMRQRVAPVDAVKASIPAPATTTVTLAAPGMEPDSRIRGAIEERRAAGRYGQRPGEARNVDDLF